MIAFLSLSLVGSVLPVPFGDCGCIKGEPNLPLGRMGRVLFGSFLVLLLLGVGVRFPTDIPAC